MVALRDSELEPFLKKRAATMNGLLFYGSDDAAVNAALRMTIRQMAGDEEPLRLDASALKSDAGVLDDAMRAMSLLGDRRLIVLTGLDENHLDRVQSVLDLSSINNFVVMAAGALRKASKFRAAVESSRLFGSVGFYQESQSALQQRVETMFRTAQLTFEQGCVERFVELVGTGRSVYAPEFEKLTLYCGDTQHVTIEMLETVCGDQAEFETDRLFEVMFDGDVQSADRIFASMIETGDAKSVLVMLQMYLARLQQVSAAVARGADISSALRNARPPVFDKQQAVASRQLKTFSGDDFEQMQTTVQAAMLQSRQVGDLSHAIVGRCVLSLVRSARQARARG
jgi:DNA polymerase-3 subunit delta